MSARRPRVAVVHNAPALSPDHPDAASEAEVIEAAEAVSAALESSGMEPTIVPAGPPLSALIHVLTEGRFDAAFNLMEGFGGLSQGATYVTGVFELLGIPYTGSTVEALAACQSKHQAKALLRGHGLPTAPALVVAVGESIPPLTFPGPYLVKPDIEDGSLGIDQGSVVEEGALMAARVRSLHSRYHGPVLIESYLPGPEFNIGLIELSELVVLPVAQVVFEPIEGHWPILTYEAKWNPDSIDDRTSPVVCPAPIHPELSQRLQSLAAAAFRSTGCRDYARVDFRLDANGRPMILEVNPNPDISPGAGLARAIGASGRSYSEVIAALAERAIANDRRR